MSRGVRKYNPSSSTLHILEPQLLEGWCHVEHLSFTHKTQHRRCKSQPNGTRVILGPYGAPPIPHLALDALEILSPETFAHTALSYSLESLDIFQGPYPVLAPL